MCLPLSILHFRTHSRRAAGARDGRQDIFHSRSRRRGLPTCQRKRLSPHLLRPALPHSLQKARSGYIPRVSRIHHSLSLSRAKHRPCQATAIRTRRESRRDTLRDETTYVMVRDHRSRQRSTIPRSRSPHHARRRQSHRRREDHSIGKNHPPFRRYKFSPNKNTSLTKALANNATTFPTLNTLHSGPDWSQKRPDLHPPKIPIISIPTTLSGGEYSFLGGGTHDHTQIKHGFGHPCIGPALVILSPELTLTTPASIWLQSGLRAIDHCIEGFCSLSCTPAAEISALKGLKLLVPNLVRCKANGLDVEARHACQMGVIEAMSVVFVHGIPMGASHGIGHQLGPLGVGHGETSCVLLPAVCEVNEVVNKGRQEVVKGVFWAEEEVGRVLRERGGLREEEASLGRVLDVFIRELELPRSLREVGVVGDETFRTLARNALADRWCGTNPRRLETEADVLGILEMVRG